MADAGVYSVVELPGWNTVPQSLTVGRYGHDLDSRYNDQPGGLF